MTRNTEEVSSERRLGVRVELRKEVRIDCDQMESAAQLEQISEGGALIELAVSLELRDRTLRVTIPFGRDPAAAAILPARVVRLDGTALALRWLQPLDFDTRFKIARLRECEAGMPRVFIGALPMLIWPVLR
ncbi:MAG TPA: PilZ domain-containing protein [Burkholderiales bacterium]|nr:PilZ domain-containing protein [Burkholderiales bacterium]